MAKAQINTALLTDESVEELESQQVVPTEVKEKKVEVNISKEFRVYIGDKWYDFKIGKDNVPEHIKEYLKNANALSAL